MPTVGQVVSPRIIRLSISGMEDWHVSQLDVCREQRCLLKGDNGGDRYACVKVSKRQQ